MIFLAFILAVAISWLFYRKTTPQLTSLRRYFLMSMRVVVLFVVFLLLLNPIWNYLLKKNEQQKIILLSDTSASMDEQKKEYFYKNTPILKDKYKKSGYKIVEYNFGDGLQGNSSNTLLLKTLANLQKQGQMNNVAAIQLLSDGWFQDEYLQQLRSFQTPINTIFPQQNLIYKDIKIEDVSHNLKAVKDEANPILVTTVASNYKGKAEVELQIDDKVVSTKKCDFSDKQFSEVGFEYTFTETGLIPLTVKIDSDSLSEANQQNNFYYSAVQVSKPDFKITILSDELSWDLKFIKDCIKRQNKWDYEIIIPKKATYKIPQQKLANTNVLVLLNNGNLRIQNPDLIENFLIKGQAVLCLGKPLTSEFSSVLGRPFRSARKSSLLITNEAEKYSSLLLVQKQQDQIPPVNYYFAKPKAQSQILAEFQNQQRSPAILFNNYNQGKILELLFDDIWQWQMSVNKSNFRQFFINIFKWLGSSEQGRFIAYPSQNSYTQGEKIQLHLQAYDEAYNLIRDLEAKVEITDDNGKIVAENYMTSDQDKYSSSFSSDLNPGQYKFRITDQNYNLQTTGKFLIQDAQQEKFNLGFNRNNLNFVSRATNGKQFTDPEQLKLPSAPKISKEIEQQIPLYKKWYIIALFIICFSLELFWRRKWGLL